jgi:hypothetical protein
MTMVTVEEVYLVLHFVNIKHSGFSHNELEGNIYFRKQKKLPGTHRLYKTARNLKLATQNSVQ